jgi:hypothetical protein
MQPHWIDADVYIQANRGLYSFEIAPPFWEWLEQCGNAGIVKSPMMVYKELARGNDKLAEWAKARRADGFFVEADESVQKAVGRMADFVKAKFIQPKYLDFLSGADPWLVAHASVGGGIVVSHEKRVDSSCTWPKIPTLCVRFGVPCINLVDLIKSIGTLKFK